MTLKIALVGTGNVAKRNYVPCLSYQEDVELGYYNRTRTKAEAIAEEFGGAVFDSLEALTAWNPDSIFVLTRETERRAVIAARKPSAYLESLRQGQSPPVPGIAGLQELQVEAAIKRSIAQQRPVDLAAELLLAP